MGLWVSAPRILKLDHFIPVELATVTLDRSLGRLQNHIELCVEEKYFFHQDIKEYGSLSLSSTHSQPRPLYAHWKGNGNFRQELGQAPESFWTLCWGKTSLLSLILRRSRTGTVWFYTSTSNKRAARPKLYTKSLTRDLKRMYSRFTLVRISINL